MAPKAEKKPAKKVAKKVAGGKGKKGKSKVESFKIYIYKVLKQVKLLYASWSPWQVSLGILSMPYCVDFECVQRTRPKHLKLYVGQAFKCHADAAGAP